MANPARQNTPPFKIESYVQMVDQFMEILGIERAPILGHSMGGTVALAFALKYPHRVTKVGVVGSPIQGQSLNFFLRLAGAELGAVGAEPADGDAHDCDDAGADQHGRRQRNACARCCCTMSIRPAWSRSSAASAICGDTDLSEQLSRLGDAGPGGLWPA